MKGLIEATKAVVVTTAVYTYLTWAVVGELRDTIKRKLRVKYVQRPMDF